MLSINSVRGPDRGANTRTLQNTHLGPSEAEGATTGQSCLIKRIGIILFFPESCTS